MAPGGFSRNHYACGRGREHICGGRGRGGASARLALGLPFQQGLRPRASDGAQRTQGFQMPCTRSASLGRGSGGPGREGEGRHARKRARHRAVRRRAPYGARRPTPPAHPAREAAAACGARPPLDDAAALPVGRAWTGGSEQCRPGRRAVASLRDPHTHTSADLHAGRRGGGGEKASANPATPRTYGIPPAPTAPPSPGCEARAGREAWI